MFVLEAVELYDLYHVIVEMVDIVEMIRRGELTYTELAYIDSSQPGIWSAISKNFAHVMDEHFLLKNEHKLDWSIIAYRRHLSWDFLVTLTERNRLTYITKRCLRDSPMSNRDILKMIRSLFYWAPKIARSKFIALQERYMSESDIDEFLKVADDEGPNGVADLENYQVLSSLQKECLRSILVRYQVI
jgi:hypothetical protein